MMNISTNEQKAVIGAIALVIILIVLSFSLVRFFLASQLSDDIQQREAEEVQREQALSKEVLSFIDSLGLLNGEQPIVQSTEKTATGMNFDVEIPALGENGQQYMINVETEGQQVADYTIETSDVSNLLVVSEPVPNEIIAMDSLMVKLTTQAHAFLQLIGANNIVYRQLEFDASMDQQARNIQLVGVPNGDYRLVINSDNAQIEIPLTIAQ